MQHNTGLSNSGVKKLVSTLNQVVSSRIVVKNFLSKFDQLSKKLESHFTKTWIKVATDKGTNQVDKLVIHCKDLKALCQQVLETRNLSDDYIMKLGVDGGGGFLKVSFGIMEKVSVLKSPPPKRLLTNSLA